MRFGILGSLEVRTADGARCDPTASRQRRLLLALLVWRGEPVSLDRLVDVVWPADAPIPRNPVSSLRTYVTRLRHVLEPDAVGARHRLLLGGQTHVQLQVEDDDVDAGVFAREVAAARAMDDDAPGALARLERALGMWRGRALDEVADEHWAQPEAVRLEHQRLDATERRFGLLLAVGRHDDAIADLERHVRHHPLRERPHAQLMSALHDVGRTAAAVAVFREFRERLADETGLDPSADLAALHERLLAAGTAPSSPDAGASSGWAPLPTPTDALLGRAGELGSLTSALAQHRVVTLSGVGGVGKTRLAVELAHATRTSSRPALFVDLARVASDDAVVDAVFASLRVPAAARTDQLAGLARILSTQPALLLLDNCEHVLDGVARLVELVAETCPHVTVLATSREPIGISGEHVHRLASLDPDAGSALFRVRATAVGTDEDLSLVDETVREICTRLDGLPLAIELAAARTAHLAVAEIASLLDDRFWLLTGGRRSLSRHQTLQAAMDWSHGLLGERERLVLRAAAVFVGDFDVDALTHVVGLERPEVLDRLGALVAASLVVARHEGGETLHRMLETVRLYALDRLADAGESADRRRAHAEYVRSLVTCDGPHIRDVPYWGTDASDHAELGDHLAALEWFERQGDLGSVGHIVARIPTVLERGDYVDLDERFLGRDDVAAALEDPEERALYLLASAGNASYLARYRDQLRFSEAALAAATDPLVRAAAAAQCANAYAIFSPERIPDLLDEVLPQVPPTAPRVRRSLRWQRPLGLIMQGRLTEAMEWLRPLVDDGDPFAASEAMLVLHLLGRDAEALELVRSVTPPVTNPWAYRWHLTPALVAAAEHRIDEARQLLVDAAVQAARSPVRLLDNDLIVGCAAIAWHAGNAVRTAQLLAVVNGQVRTPGSFTLYTTLRDLVRAAIPDVAQRHAIRRHAAGLDPTQILHEELGSTGQAYAPGTARRHAT